MNLSQLPEFDYHEFVIALHDKESGLEGFIAVHSRDLGMAHGGTRMKPYGSSDEALVDALELSKAMSYKSALAGLPYGGAKGVIIEKPGQDRQAVLTAYAKKVEALGGLFHTGTDVGLTDEDTRAMAEHSQYLLGTASHYEHDFSTSRAAATGVYYAIRAALAHKTGNESVAGKRIGIKGVGKLGSALADLLHADGAQLVIADTDGAQAVRVTGRLPGTVVVSPDEIASQDLDVYAPCALGHEFTADNYMNVRAKLIVGGANNQLETEKVGELLAMNGVTYVPDFVANAGGLIFVSEELEQDGFNFARLEKRLAHIPEVVTEILRQADERQMPASSVAITIARQLIGAQS